jgi:hypothetical protein
MNGDFFFVVDLFANSASFCRLYMCSGQELIRKDLHLFYLLWSIIVNTVPEVDR